MHKKKKASAKARKKARSESDSCTARSQCVGKDDPISFEAIDADSACCLRARGHKKGSCYRYNRDSELYNYVERSGAHPMDRETKLKNTARGLQTADTNKLMCLLNHKILKSPKKLKKRTHRTTGTTQEDLLMDDIHSMYR